MQARARSRAPGGFSYRTCHGVSSATLRNTEGMAKIKLPSGLPGLGTARWWTLGHCAHMLMGDCIQVLGLLMDTNDIVAGTEVMVCVGTGKTTYQTP